MAGENEPHTETPDEGMHGEADSTDDTGVGSYEDVNHVDAPHEDVAADGDDDGADDGDDDGADDGADDTGHYVESDTGSGHHDTHPDHGEYVERDDEEPPA